MREKGRDLARQDKLLKGGGTRVIGVRARDSECRAFAGRQRAVCFASPSRKPPPPRGRTVAAEEDWFESFKAMQQLLLLVLLFGV